MVLGSRPTSYGSRMAFIFSWKACCPLASMKFSSPTIIAFPVSSTKPRNMHRICKGDINRVEIWQVGTFTVLDTTYLCYRISSMSAGSILISAHRSFYFFVVALVWYALRKKRHSTTCTSRTRSRLAVLWHLSHVLLALKLRYCKTLIDSGMSPRTGKGTLRFVKLSSWVTTLLISIP